MILDAIKHVELGPKHIYACTQKLCCFTTIIIIIWGHWKGTSQKQWREFHVPSKTHLEHKMPNSLKNLCH